MANVTNTMSKVSFKISTVFDTKDKMENKQVIINLLKNKEIIYIIIQ